MEKTVCVWHEGCVKHSHRIPTKRAIVGQSIMPPLQGEVPRRGGGVGNSGQKRNPPCRRWRHPPFNKGGMVGAEIVKKAVGASNAAVCHSERSEESQGQVCR